MTRLRLALPRATVPALLVAAALAANGCGGETKTNGLEKLSAAAVQQKAAAALEAAKSAHVKGTRVSDGDSVEFDLRIDGTSSSGALRAEGVQLGITRIGNITYIKAGRRALKKLGVSRAVRRVGAGRWLKLGPQQVTNVEGFSLGDLARQLAKNHSPREPRVEQATLDGRQVVVVSRQDGSRLYVANTGIAYPLRGDYKGSVAGRLDFTEYGADFRITAPANPVDIAELLHRG
jgi:hypothetical protein